MDDETLTALKASIAKWKRNAEAETPKEYLVDSDDCPLCDVFWTPDRGCGVCPVRERTGKSYCWMTPYNAARNALLDWFLQRDNGAKRAHTAARAEVAFLESLLPPEASHD